MTFLKMLNGLLIMFLLGIKLLYCEEIDPIFNNKIESKNVEEEIQMMKRNVR